MKSLPIKHGDFFPFFETDHNSWTGFYTSKAMFKKLVRATSQHVQSMKILLVKLLFSKKTKWNYFLMSQKN